MIPSYDETKSALCSGEITLHYQPIVDLATGELRGYEALARWGQVPPPTIAAIVEGYGLELLWIRQQVAAIDAVLAQVYPPIWVSLNIAQAQLKLPGLPTILATSPHGEIQGLHLEVLESVHIDPELADILRQLKVTHILKADDIGNHDYEWMSRLMGEYADLFDELKICRGLTEHILSNHRAAAACHAIISLAIGLGLRVTGEWIHCPQQAALLRDWGCMFAQGELYGMAKPWEEIWAKQNP